jgi:hypothetical protein
LDAGLNPDPKSKLHYAILGKSEVIGRRLGILSKPFEKVLTPQSHTELLTGNDSFTAKEERNMVSVFAIKMIVIASTPQKLGHIRLLHESIMPC